MLSIGVITTFIALLMTAYPAHCQSRRPPRDYGIVQPHSFPSTNSTVYNPGNNGNNKGRSRSDGRRKLKDNRKKDSKHKTRRGYKSD